ncbi:MAG: hypothetical protein EA391_01440 [Balneolaceae bacterium]|nr:MAG: hypothetical protein EA391_01440 [Balneolaceae bacterium]
MITMMKFSSLLLGALLVFGFSSHAYAVTDDSSLIGSWEFNVNGAPWEYSRGVIVVEPGDDGELSGKVEFSTGRIVQLASISIEEDTVIFEVNVDGYDVKSDLKLSGDDLQGVVQTIEGNMNFSATRAVSER